MAIYLGDQVIGINNVFEVPVSGTIQPLNVTSNGTYTALAGSSYSPINVNIPPAMYALRPDAEKVQTTTWDRMVVQDLDLTIPSYSTSEKVLMNSTALNTYTVDLNNYDYYIILRTLSIPTYNITTKGKGRQEYAFSSYIYELVKIPSNTISAISDPTKLYTSTSNTTFFASQAINRDVYYSSGTALSFYTAVTYALAITISAPTLSGNTLTINSGKVAIRGSTTYLTSTYFNAITDARVQLVADIYRAPKNNSNIDGWSAIQNIMHIIECAQSSSHTLT